MKLHEHWVKSVDDVFESMTHGATLTKFVAHDSGSTDLSIEIHGFVDEQGRLIIVSEKMERKEKAEE